MIYLKHFDLPTLEQEAKILYCHDYPFGIFPFKGLRLIEFSDITVLCGGNGSGKTTLLNLIAESLNLPRITLFNTSDKFHQYIKMCDFKVSGGRHTNTAPDGSAIYTSDDIFYGIIDRRVENAETKLRQRDTTDEYLANQQKDHDGDYVRFDLKQNNYDELAQRIETRRRTMSKYVKFHAGSLSTPDSNGEFALKFYGQHFTENALYLLDEPENSLSPKYQLKLAGMIEDYARFFGCQFIIASHSPFFISLKNAAVYDFDDNPIHEKPWWKIENMKLYYSLFASNKSKFE